jgi:hypothetical protein
MQTLPVAEPNVKAFYCVLFDQHGVLGKVDGQIYFFGDDGQITEYEPEMANFCTVLGRTDLADTQRIMDVVVHGGYARVACSRAMEVA